MYITYTYIYFLLNFQTNRTLLSHKAIFTRICRICYIIFIYIIYIEPQDLIGKFRKIKLNLSSILNQFRSSWKEIFIAKFSTSNSKNNSLGSSDSHRKSPRSSSIDTSSSLLPNLVSSQIPPPPSSHLQHPCHPSRLCYRVVHALNHLLLRFTHN